MVRPHIRRTEICRILPSVRRELRNNMIERDRVASRPQCQSPVNVIVIPLINMLKTVNDCSPASWENQTIQYPDRLDQEKFLRLSRETVNEGLTLT